MIVDKLCTGQSAEDIIDDEHAVDILNEICILVVNDVKSSHGEERNFGSAATRSEMRFTHDANDIFAGPDFSLFLCMLLVNREALVRKSESALYPFSK